MATPAETPRLRQIRDELLDALDYEETKEVAKAERVITLTKQLLLMRHDASAHAGSSFSNSPEKLQKLQEDARLWIRCNAGNGTTSSGGGSSTIYHQPSRCFRG